MAARGCPAVTVFRVCAGLVLISFLLVLADISAYAAGPASGRHSRGDLVFLPAHRLAAMIAAREVSSTEVVRAYLEQIRNHNPKLNALVFIDEKGALEQAREADEATARGQIRGPLHGVPVTIKDNYAVKGMQSTNSSPELAGFVPGFDASAVARLKAAGAIVLGKENMPLGGMDYQTRSPLFGATNNPWDTGRTPGGSTGGGAAAVAAGLSSLSLGNDIGGSIRLPSHFCGIYGIMPTGNLVPSYGVPPNVQEARLRAIRHLASYGPLARSIGDLELCLKVIAGPDVKDVCVPDIPLTEPKARALKDLRIAWTDGFGGRYVSEDTRRAIAGLAERLAREGCTVVKDSPEDFDFKGAWAVYGRLLDMEAGTYSPSYMRFVQYTFGWFYRRDVPFLAMAYPHTHRKYLVALTERERYVACMEKFFQRYDAWICPTASTTAYRHIRPDYSFGPYPVYLKPVEVDGHALNYLAANGCHTTVFNLTGSPVVVIPIGYAKDGMPIGAQIAGKRWHDIELLRVAGLIDRVAGAFRSPPGYR